MNMPLRAEKYIQLEEMVVIRADHGRCDREGRRESPRRSERSRKRDKTSRVGRFDNYIPLNVSLTDLYKEICQTERLS